MKYLRKFESYKTEILDDIFRWAKIHGNQRIHISDKPIDEIKDVEQRDILKSKPRGLWYSFGDEWANFSYYEDWIDVEHAYVLEVDKSKLLRLITEEDVHKFTIEYSPKEYLVDWRGVSEKWSGIEIPTYYKFNFRNLHRKDPIYNWLYPWDVSSGCIWKKDALKSIKKIS